MSIIKMEEQSFLLSSPSPDLIFNQCFDFYDEQSNNFIVKSQCTSKEIMYFLRNNVDLCDTPLKEILKIIQENYYDKDADMPMIKKMIVKQKYLLKRNRAKNRKDILKDKKDIALVAVALCDKGQEEECKKKNRISAQMSRDKKKKRVKELEEMNKRLQEECIIHKMENQKLKETIQSDRIKGQSACTNGNKLRKMLIFLGIIFLCGLIKGIFTNDDSMKLRTLLLNLPAEKSQTVFLDSSKIDQRQKVLSVIQTPLTNLFEDQSLSMKLKDRLFAQIQLSSQANTLLPLRLKSQIESIKSENLL